MEEVRARSGGAAGTGRRALLRRGLGMVACLAALGPREVWGHAAPRPRPSVRRVSFLNLHTDERLTAEYWVRGRYLPDALAEINRLLRDHRTGEVHPIDPGLIDLVHDLQQLVDSRQPFHIISGYRSPRTNALLRAKSHRVARNSFHMRGMAIDLRLPEVSTRALYRAAWRLQGGGVGYYGRSDFIHMDVGPVRTW